MAIENLKTTLQQRFGVTMRQESLLQQALTHASFRNEQADPEAVDNERLEFLGDAVLELAVSSWLFRRFPDSTEGDMTRQRAEMVNAQSLAAAARELDLGACLRLGRGEEATGGRAKESVLADAFEAVLGAIYLDVGFDAAQILALGLLTGKAAVGLDREVPALTDYKTRLQELLQAQHGRLPVYLQTAVTGPPHQRVFCAEVRFDGRLLGTGEGGSKKAAEQQAARRALQTLETP